MKRILSLVLVFLAMFFVSCDTNQSNAVEEYDRVGKSYITARAVALIDAKEAFESADIVAMVKIDDLDGIYMFPDGVLGVTVFSATVIKDYRDNGIYENIKIYIEQMGTPEGTIVKLPLYKIGDVMIMFLKTSSYDAPYKDTYSGNIYSIMNEGHGALQVITVNEQTYVVDRMLGDFCRDIKSSAVNESVKEKVVSELYKYDSILEKHAISPSAVYTLETFEGLIQTMSNVAGPYERTE